MKRILIFLTVSISCLSFALASAQTKQQIMNCGDYYYGEATADVLQEAKDLALKNLSEGISVQVSISTVNMEKELNMSPTEYRKSVIGTYSIQTLSEVGYISDEVGNEINVFAYVHKDVVKQVFEERKELIYDIYKKALESENNANVADALKYYYFSIVLMNSLPDDVLEYKGIKFHTELPARINTIMSKLNFAVHSIRNVYDNDKQVILNITHNKKPVQKIDFDFWDGSYSVTIEGCDGQATILLNRSLNKIDVRPVYSYYDCRDEFKAVGELWSLVNKPTFDRKFQVSLEKPVETKKAKMDIAADKVPINEEQIITNIKIETEKFVDLIKGNNVNKIKNVFPNDGYIQKQLKDLLELNKIRIVETDMRPIINPTYEGWELRSIPVVVIYPTLNKQVTENIVLNFDRSGTLIDIQFTVFEGMYEEALKDANTEEEKQIYQILLKFIEKYRSSFMCRDIEMIDALISDDVLIFDGGVFRRIPINKDVDYTKEGYQEIRFTNKNYINNLKRVFNRQEDIHLGFNSFKAIIINNRPGIYSVGMRLNLSSAEYYEEGYLFLLISFNEPQPKIYVRSWQSGECSEERMIQMSDFLLN